jgi:predicted RNase H-like nuclease (RuvC/YqgF family)
MSYGQGARRPGPAPQPRGSKDKIEDITRQFWDLQQIEETPEEAEYARLCEELQEMLTRFREELVALERENTELQSRFDGYSDLKEQAAALREEEAKLLQLKRDLDAADRY